MPAQLTSSYQLYANMKTPFDHVVIETYKPVFDKDIADLKFIDQREFNIMSTDFTPEGLVIHEDGEAAGAKGRLYPIKGFRYLPVDGESG